MEAQVENGTGEELDTVDEEAVRELPLLLAVPLLPNRYSESLSAPPHVWEELPWHAVLQEVTSVARMCPFRIWESQSKMRLGRLISRGRK